MSDLKAKVHMWLAAPLEREVKLSLARLAEAEDVVWLAVMPDVHLAGDVCIGTAVATRRLIYPACVGGDIGCGMAAMSFDAEAALLADEARASRLLTELRLAVPCNRQPHALSLPGELEKAPLSCPALDRAVRRDARVQLGTLGRGNHFLEFQADEDGRLWLMVHSGSRAAGQAIRDYHVSRRSSSGRTMTAIDAESPEGAAYLADAQWAMDYAAANRRSIAMAAAAAAQRALGAAPMTESYFECNHNHVRREEHFGQRLWVHRKGAAPAGEGVLGIIPGSMGTASFHVLGRGCAASLCSSAHGASRAMGRAEARLRISPRLLSRQMQGVWYDVLMAEALREEAPGAYKDIARVMRAQRELVKTLRRLRPVLSFKGV